MIHTKALKFRYEGIDFEATVTYSDSPFALRSQGEEEAFYQVNLHEPIEMDCGGEVKNMRGTTLLILSYSKKEPGHFVYTEEKETLCENEINVYPKAIEKILYSYFNRDQIAHYKKQVKQFRKAIDAKYASQMESIRAEKLALRKKLRAGEIDSKVYQKRLKPIRLKKEETEHKVWYLKHQYEKRYFECCELKQYYCTVKAEKTAFCDDRYLTCGLASYYAKMKKEK